jgi:hypothetical protein
MLRKLGAAAGEAAKDMVSHHSVRAHARLLPAAGLTREPWVTQLAKPAVGRIRIPREISWIDTSFSDWAPPVQDTMHAEA